MRIKSERLKIKRGWNWKIFLISWFIQNEKNSNKKERDQMWTGNKLQGLVWFFKGEHAEFKGGEREKGNKKRSSMPNQMRFRGMPYLTAFGAPRSFKHHPGRCFSNYI